MGVARGSIHAAIVTPAGPDGGVDAGRTAAHARRLLARGCHGLAVFGTTGEANPFSAAANLNAAASRAVHDAFGAGDTAAAEAGTGRVTAVRKVLESRPLIPAVKHVLAEAHGDPAWARVRPPLTPLDAAAGAELRRALATAGWACAGDPEPRAAAA
jgi:dihydrodipicolinate synthase/N-acetylneuraminate lyase